MNGKVTIVTGGAQGIGRAITELLADKGSDIVIFDIIDGSEAVSAVKGKGRRCAFSPPTWRSGTRCGGTA